MLDDHTGRDRELPRKQARGREVVEVVERERLAVDLRDTGEEVRTTAALGVVRGALVRVLAVREIEDFLERQHECLRERFELREPRGDRGVVRRRGCEGFRGEFAPRLE